MELFCSSGSGIKKLYQNACATDVYNLYSYICKKNSMIKMSLTSWLSVIFAFLLISCDDDDPKKQSMDEMSLDGSVAQGALSVNAEKSTIYWTAFKTTEKVPVKGSFKQINIVNAPKGSTVEELLDGLSVSVPVSGLFTDMEERDAKLKKFFFGAMANTELLSGTFHVKEQGKAVFSLLMNGVESNLDMDYQVDNAAHTVTFSGVLILDNWAAQAALKSINDACIDLHKGADGVSKTWNEVGVKAVAYIDGLETPQSQDATAPMPDKE